MASLAAIYSLAEAHRYEERRYDTDAYISTPVIISILTKTEKICADITDKNKRISCTEAYESIASHASTHDLVAQETVALATKGLLKVAGLQAACSFLTLAFLIWTVFITRDIRNDATDATLAATKAAKAAIGAEGAFLVVEPICEICKDKESHFDFFIQIKNYGRTPALNIEGWIDFGSEANAAGDFVRMSRAFPKMIAGRDRYVIEQTRIRARIANYGNSLSGRYQTNIKGICPITYHDIFTDDRREALCEGFNVYIDFDGHPVNSCPWEVGTIGDMDDDWDGETIESFDPETLSDSEMDLRVASTPKHVVVARWSR